jgi:hypothetical protein
MSICSDGPLAGSTDWMGETGASKVLRAREVHHGRAASYADRTFRRLFLSCVRMHARAVTHAGTRSPEQQPPKET